MNVNAETTLGFGHFIAGSDPVGKTLLALLLLMSLLSWLIIALKGLTLIARRSRSHAFLNFFWNATSLYEVQGEISTHGVHEPFAHLTAHAMHAKAHHAKYGAAKLAEAGGEQEYLTRTIKKVLDEETMQLESGLTMLATIGATAPFVYKSVDWWRTVHPKTSVMTTLGETSPEMWYVVWFCTFTILLFMGLLLAARIRLEEQRAALDQLYLAAED